MGKWGCAEIVGGALPAEKASLASRQIIPSATPKNVYCNDLMGLIGLVNRGATAAARLETVGCLTAASLFVTHPRIRLFPASQGWLWPRRCHCRAGLSIENTDRMLFTVENPPAQSVSEIRPLKFLPYRQRLVVGV
jgi:hypothetical protein